jgi:hypothetical protein
MCRNCYWFEIKKDEPAELYCNLLSEYFRMQLCSDAQKLNESFRFGSARMSGCPVPSRKTGSVWPCPEHNHVGGHFKNGTGVNCPRKIHVHPCTIGNSLQIQTAPPINDLVNCHLRVLRFW